jgi:hypothetical protein
MTLPAGPSRGDPQALALGCLAHLEQEEALLTETVSSLREVRSALLGGDLAALGAALERQSQWAHRAGDLQVRRAALRTNLAAVLGVEPALVTVSMLAGRLPADAGARLASCRQRLTQMATEVDQLNRANVALLHHSLEFLHRFLVEITGGQSHGPSYTAAGTLREATCGSLIEARG